MSVSKIITIDGTQYTVLDHDIKSLHPEYYGLSTDTKPTTGVENASVFYEMDTQKVFMFDEDSASWLEQ